MHFGLDVELKLVEHRRVDVEQAIGILRDVHARQQPRYETGEEALAATNCGFSRADNDYIDLVVNGRDDISVRVELPIRVGWWVFKSKFEARKPKESLQAAEEWIRKYYALEHADMAEAMRSHAADRR